MSKSAAKQAVRIVSPLFPAFDPPIFADEITKINIFRQKMHRGQPIRSRIVNFEAEHLMDANGGLFSIDFHETDEEKLVEALEKDELKRGEIDEYLIVAIGENGAEIATRPFTANVEEDEDEDEDDDGEVKETPTTRTVTSNEDLAMKMFQESQRNARMAEKRPLEMLQVFAAMNSPKRDPDEAMKLLQEELRAARTRHEDELRQARMLRDADVAKIQETKDREITRLQDDLRIERQRADDREKALRDENRDIRKRADDDVRAVRDRADKELDAYRKEATDKIFELQKTVLSLQTDSQKELLKKSEELMQERMKAALATREVEDAKMALESAEETMEEQLKGAAAAAAGEELPPWAKMMMPFAKPLIEKLMASGQPLPQNPQEVQQLVDRIQIPPVQPSYMPAPEQQYAQHVEQEPAVRTQQPRMSAMSTPEPEEPDESDEDESEDEGDDSEENAAE